MSDPVATAPVYAEELRFAQPSPLQVYSARGGRSVASSENLKQGLSCSDLALVQTGVLANA